MKEITTYAEAVEYLNKLFDLLNARFFDNELERPTITIQSTPKALGHFSTRKDTWVSSNGVSHEVNIGAGNLACEIDLLLSVLCHELVHYYCHIHGIKDVSRGTMYHNKRFKEAAEAHGLIVERDPKYGWTITSANDEMVAFIEENQLDRIHITRNEFQWLRIPGLTGNGDKAIVKDTSKSNSRKYICPCCGNSVRATKVVNIACVDCREVMVFAG